MARFDEPTSDADVVVSLDLVDVGEAWLASPGDHVFIDEGEEEFVPTVRPSALDAPWMPLVLSALVIALLGLVWATSSTSPAVSAPAWPQPVLAPVPVFQPMPSVAARAPAQSMKKAAVRRHR